MTLTRFAVAVAALLAATAAADAQPPTAPPPHPPLAELVAEFKRLGLPFPPPNAQLVRIDGGDRFVERFRDEPNDTPYSLAFRVPPATPGGRVRYLAPSFFGVGLHEKEYVEPAAVEEAAPTPDALLSVEWEPARRCLTFAVQFKDRGWDELAARLYALALAQEDFADDGPPSTAMEKVRLIAWNYWLGPTMRRGGDRKEALRRLTALAAEDDAFRTPENFELLRRLALTVAPRTAKPGTVEALIDDLTEYRNDGDYFFPRVLDGASYWELAERGFDAVPALIDHLGDDRLTRASEAAVTKKWSYRLTVGHLCSRLLSDLSARAVGHYSDGLGGRLDPAAARKWFEKAKEVGEEKWLLDHAVPADGGVHIVNQTGRPEPQIVRVIGAKYPARLPAVYRAMLKQPVKGEFLKDYVTEIVASKLTRAEKVALLEEGAASDDPDHRFLALEGLARLDPALVRKPLLGFLAQVRRDVDAGKPDAIPDDARLVRLVESADDSACWDALVAVGRAADVNSRLDLIERISRYEKPAPAGFRRPARIRFLVQFLADDTAGVKEADDSYREGTAVCDLAATQLAGLLGFTVAREHDFVYYPPVHDKTRGPLTRMYLRAAVWQAAARELAATK